LVDGARKRISAAVEGSHHGWMAAHPARVAAVTSLAYLAGAKLGFVLTFAPNPTSVLWPPNAILLAVLLLAPVRQWPLILAAVLPAHLFVQLTGGVPLPMALSWFVSNCGEALLGAAATRWIAGGPFRLDRLRHVVAFVACGVLLSPLLLSFVDAGLVRLNGWGEVGYWEIWRTRALSNVLAALTIVPPIVSWARGFPSLRSTTRPRLLEMAALAGALVAFGVAAFASNFFGASETFPVVFYLPVPLLIWAALRFGTAGVGIAFSLVASLVIWGAAHGRGPFHPRAATEGPRPVQLYLIFLAPPLLALGAALEEREAVRRQLRASEERFSRAFRSSPVAMSISRGSDGSVIDVNERWESLFGYPRSEALGHDLLALLHLAPEVQADLELRPAFGSVARNLELDARNRAGDAIRLVVAIEAVELAGEACLLTTLSDITEQRRAVLEAQQQRRQLTHLSRVNLLGELSGAIAHELNQPLTAILANAQAGERFLDQTPADLGEIRDILQEIATADRRAATVIARLRSLLRNDEVQAVPLDLNEVLEEALELAHGEVLTQHVTVMTRLGSKLPQVLGDRVQLQQLFLNLLANACDAMSSVEPARRVVTVMSESCGTEMVVATICDTGSGIADDGMERVFEPFFTTKPKGLGLGLAICRTIVTAHGGRIWAENDAEGGARFVTALPASPGAVS
jgi:two-component system sensor kinase FixL